MSVYQIKGLMQVLLQEHKGTSGILWDWTHRWMLWFWNEHPSMNSADFHICSSEQSHYWNALGVLFTHQHGSDRQVNDWLKSSVTELDICVHTFSFTRWHWLTFRTALDVRKGYWTLNFKLLLLKSAFCVWCFIVSCGLWQIGMPNKNHSG